MHHIVATIALVAAAISTVAWLSPKAVASVDAIQGAYEKNGPGMDRSGHCADVVWPHVPARCLDATVENVRLVGAPERLVRESEQARAGKAERLAMNAQAWIEMAHRVLR